MPGSVAVLFFRLAVVAALYFFLLQVLRTVWKELNPVPAHAPRRSSAGLEIVQPASARLRRGDIIPLHRAITIGRETGNDLVVDEETVSSRHSRLSIRDGRWWIEDLGSRNGTLVNDAQIVHGRHLGSGDLIQIGRVCLRFIG
jgi:pSer/pThr/pTyr-binding forkhead associated (FHA) protein